MKRRILFVEDNLVLLQLYGLMMKGHTEWEVESVGSGEEALQRMATAPFDVVVSDMRMPGMDGVQLMREIKQHHPRASRIILSGVRDQKEIAECLGDTHQFLAKPITAKTLKATLTKLCGLDAYLQDEKLRALATRLGTLPSFPLLYLDILQELATEDPSLKKIGNIVAQDPAMTAKMLQITNSAAFGLAQPVHSPLDAVQYVGTSTVRSLALTTHVFSAFERNGLTNFSIADLWDHALKTADLARAISREMGLEAAELEDAYTAGMLHDLGKLMLAANLKEQFQQSLNLASEQNLPLHAAEQQVFGATHAGVGAYLLGLWGLPTPIVEAVAFHHSPWQSDCRTPSPLAAVHVANVLEHELGGPDLGGAPASLDAGYLVAIGMQDRLEAWRTQAAKLLAAKAG